MDDQLKQIIDHKTPQREADLILALAILQLAERVKRLEKLIYGGVGIVLSAVLVAIVGLVIKQ